MSQRELDCALKHHASVAELRINTVSAKKQKLRRLCGVVVGGAFEDPGMGAGLRISSLREDRALTLEPAAWQSSSGSEDGAMCDSGSSDDALDAWVVLPDGGSARMISGGRTTPAHMMLAGLREVPLSPPPDRPQPAPALRDIGMPSPPRGTLMDSRAHRGMALVAHAVLSLKTAPFASRRGVFSDARGVADDRAPSDEVRRQRRQRAACRPLSTNGRLRKRKRTQKRNQQPVKRKRKRPLGPCCTVASRSRLPACERRASSPRRGSGSPGAAPWPGLASHSE